MIEYGLEYIDDKIIDNSKYDPIARTIMTIPSNLIAHELEWVDKANVDYTVPGVYKFGNKEPLLIYGDIVYDNSDNPIKIYDKEDLMRVLNTHNIIRTNDGNIITKDMLLFRNILTDKPIYPFIIEQISRELGLMYMHLENYEYSYINDDPMGISNHILLEPPSVDLVVHTPGTIVQYILSRYNIEDEYYFLILKDFANKIYDVMFKHNPLSVRTSVSMTSVVIDHVDSPTSRRYMINLMLKERN